MKRLLLICVAAGLTAPLATALTDDGKNRDDSRQNDGRRWRRGGFRPGFSWGPGVGYGITYTSPLGWSQSYYDPFLADQNQAILEFQRQQSRLETERALQAEADAQAAAADRIAAVKVETRRKRSAASAKLAAKNFTAGNYRNAAANYLEAAGLVPDDASIYFMLAQSQFAMKRFVDAAQTLRTAIKANPRMIDFDVLSFYKTPEDFREQLQALADELRTNPLNRDAMFLLGHMLYVSGQKGNAKTILLESARLGADGEVLKAYLDSYQPPATVR